MKISLFPKTRHALNNYIVTWDASGFKVTKRINGRMATLAYSPKGYKLTNVMYFKLGLLAWIGAFKVPINLNGTCCYRWIFCND